jgi:hypothetical protein
VTANLRLIPYNDHDDATLTSNVALPTGFEAENTQNTRRGEFLRTSDTTTLVVTGVLPESRAANCFFLFRHKLHGASVRLQLFTDAGASAAASGGDSGPNAALCYTPTDTYTWSPSGAVDLFGSDAAYWFYYGTTVTYRSYKLTVSGSPSAVSYFEIGRIFIGKYLELAKGVAYGFQLGRKDLSRSNRTDGGSRRAHLAESYRYMTGDLVRLVAAERATWMQILQQAGTGRDMVISVLPGDGNSLERDYTMNGCFSNLDAIGHDVSRFTGRIQIEEN